MTVLRRQRRLLLLLLLLMLLLLATSAAAAALLPQAERPRLSKRQRFICQAARGAGPTPAGEHNMTYAIIAEAVRTPRGKGKDKGSLKSLKPAELLAQALVALALHLCQRLIWLPLQVRP